MSCKVLQYLFKRIFSCILLISINIDNANQIAASHLYTGLCKRFQLIHSNGSAIARGKM